ncbi:TPA: hypothetical protein ACH3X3_15290 [Trebouxia sp. C0006]
MPCLLLSAVLHMEISVLKTKVMIVSPVPAPAVAFSCNDNPIEPVTSFKYLGLHFHQTGAVAHLVTPIKSKAGGSWAAVQRRHSLLQCGKTINLHLHLLQAVLVSVLLYGCQVWGMHSPRVATANAVLVWTCNACMITTSGQSVVCCLRPRVGCCWQS